MGQKVHPYGIRLNITNDWNSVWYRDSDYAQVLHDDLRARKYLKNKYKAAGVSRIRIERPAKNAVITIYSARPGTIIGKKGGGIEALRKEMSAMLNIPVHINIQEVRKPETDATLVAESVAQQLEHRVMFRRAMKRAVANALRFGAKGIKICVGGRLGGTEIARSEWYREGRVPLHTFRANVDFGTATAKTTYGVIGVKVWIFKGEVIPQKERETKETTE